LVLGCRLVGLSGRVASRQVGLRAAVGSSVGLEEEGKESGRLSLRNCEGEMADISIEQVPRTKTGAQEKASGWWVRSRRPARRQRSEGRTGKTGQGKPRAQDTQTACVFAERRRWWVGGDEDLIKSFSGSESWSFLPPKDREGERAAGHHHRWCCTCRRGLGICWACQVRVLAHRHKSQMRPNGRAPPRSSAPGVTPAKTLGAPWPLGSRAVLPFSRQGRPAKLMRWYFDFIASLAPLWRYRPIAGICRPAPQRGEVTRGLFGSWRSLQRLFPVLTGPVGGHFPPVCPLSANATQLQAVLNVHIFTF
jgi:hypothetical protein